MTNATDVAEINLTIENAKDNVAFKDAIVKLYKNREFKKVILEGYFEKNAQRLVMLKADPSRQNPDKQADIVRAIDAVGELYNFFQGRVQIGLRSAESLTEYENTREEVLAEGLVD